MKKLISILALYFFAIPLVFCQDGYEDVVDSILQSMSVRRKIAQLMVVTADPRYGQARQDEENHCVRDEQVGGIIIMGKDLQQAMERTNRLQGFADLPLLEFMDAEWGAAMRLSGFRPFPRQERLAKLGSDSLVYEMGRAIAYELKQIKVQVNLAPDIDINVNPDNVVIGSRSFGSDREVVAGLGLAYMKGLQDGGVAACAKHFPGHGDTSVDSHKGLPLLDFDMHRLDSIELYPFRKLFSEGLQMLMVGHLCVPALDPEGMPASVSKAVISDFIKGSMGYDGLVVCDALNMQSVIKMFGGSGTDTCLAAYKAGVDILLMPTDVSASLDIIESGIKSGELSEEDLNSRVRKVLLTKARAGMLAADYNRFVNYDDLDVNSSSEVLDSINGKLKTVIDQ